MKPILIIVGALILGGIIVLMSKTPSPQTNTVTQQQGASFMQAFENTPGATLIDVRTPEEYAEGHIPGARNIDIEGDAFVSSIEALDHSAPYFVYCRSGNRSGQAVAFMKQQGFTNITELSGGILAAPSLVQ